MQGVKIDLTYMGFAVEPVVPFASDGNGGGCSSCGGVTPLPGLYFIGLPWLYTWGSGRFSGIARDAEYLAGRIAARLAPVADLAPEALAG